MTAWYNDQQAREGADTWRSGPVTENNGKNEDWQGNNLSYDGL